MAIPEYSLGIIKQIVTAIRQVKGNEPKRIMSLGYPDILVHPDRVRKIFEFPDSQAFEFHPDSQAIAKWHGVSTVTEKVVESRALFSLLGFQLDVLDIVKARGDEIIVDLNEPCSQEFSEIYDLVIDTGTLEHCFNVGQAMKNVASMVKKGGFIFQNTPLNWFNHGFLQLQSNLLLRFLSRKWVQSGNVLRRFQYRVRSCGFLDSPL